jgi:hypothetical protein
MYDMIRRTFPLPLHIMEGCQYGASRCNVQVTQMLLHVVHVACELSLKWLPLRSQESRNSRPFTSASLVINVDSICALEEAEEVSVHSNHGVVQRLVIDCLWPLRKCINDANKVSDHLGKLSEVAQDPKSNVKDSPHSSEHNDCDWVGAGRG